MAEESPLPMISIVIPAYNVEKYIARTLESVLSQTYSNWEAIVVDDGSTDQTALIVKELAARDPRIHYTWKSNGGQGSARNKGIAEARSEWIALLDADDVWMPEKLELQWKCILQEKTFFVYSQILYIEGDDEHQTTSSTWITGHSTGNQMFRELFLHSAITPSTVLFHKKILSSVGGFDENRGLIGTEDWDLWLRIARAGIDFYGMPEQLVKYRVHSENTHKRTLQMLTGKLITRSKYDDDPEVPVFFRTQMYRRLLREIMIERIRSRNTSDYTSYFQRLQKQDPRGFVTQIQARFIKLLSPRAFHFLSLILYKISYPVENKLLTTKLKKL